MLKVLSWGKRLVGAGLLSLVLGCQGIPGLENRLAVNPALLNPSPAPAPTGTPAPSLTPEPSPSIGLASPSPAPITGAGFTDLDALPAPQREAIEALSQLGIFSPSGAFEAERPVSRGEFAQWLARAHNRFFQDQPGAQIRLASPGAAPIFSDLPAASPYFPEVQALAAAGLIPSPLNPNAKATLFRPGAALTREEMLAWKVPLDSRRALPAATLESLKETWGFQDLAKVNPLYWRFLLGDFQNGDQSNIRRAFGFTTLFLPQQSVTRGEAALILSYFGFQGEGRSAQTALTLETNPQPSPAPSLEASPAPSP
jgi:hypothetical protein